MVPWSMLWLLLLLAITLRQYLLRQSFLWDRLDGITAVFVVWVILDSWITGRASNARLAWNAGWTWVALLASFLVMRRAWSGAAARRAVLAAVVAMATANAAHGLYQYAWSLPLQRSRYERASPAERRQMLREAGLTVEIDSPVAKQFEDRLRSTEPYGPFGLANSLAGFLAPWCIVALAVADRGASAARPRSQVTAFLAGAVCLFCLVLTKSRSAWVAATVGALWLIIREASPERNRSALRKVMLLVVVAATCVAAAIAWGALDRQVVTQALMSFQYRLQYWQAALKLLWDHPWWGCGPGNFQTYYVQYKLPEASETVADPHQFLLEVAATMGLPAVACFITVTVLALARSGQHADPPPLQTTPMQDTSRYVSRNVHFTQEVPKPFAWWAVYAGILAAALCAPAYGWIVDLPSETLFGAELPVVWFVGIPVGTVVLAGLHPWVKSGVALHRWTWIALAVLAVNLAAAGGVSYPNVAQSWWLLAAVAAPLRPPETAALSANGFTSRAGRYVSALACLFAAVIAVLAAITAYRPVVEGNSLVRQAASQTVPPDALELLRRAAQVDPWSPEPWRWLAQLHFEWWVALPNQETRRAWQDCLQEARRRDPLSHPLAEWEGQLALRAYRLRREQQDLERAVRSFQRALELYPNSAFSHAQLAWSLALAGQRDRAAHHARLALELDGRHPHIEQKLANRTLPEPELGKLLDEDSVAISELKAEHWMHRLRNNVATGEN